MRKWRKYKKKKEKEERIYGTLSTLPLSITSECFKTHVGQIHIQSLWENQRNIIMCCTNDMKHLFNFTCATYALFLQYHSECQLLKVVVCMGSQQREAQSVFKCSKCVLIFKIRFGVLIFALTHFEKLAPIPIPIEIYWSWNSSLSLSLSLFLSTPPPALSLSLSLSLSYTHTHQGSCTHAHTPHGREKERGGKSAPQNKQTRWPSGWGIRLESGRSWVPIPLATGFFGVESYQWLQNWQSSGYPARRLAL